MSANTVAYSVPPGAGHAVWPSKGAFPTDAAILPVSPGGQPSAVGGAVLRTAAVSATRPARGSRKQRTKVEAERLRIAQELHDGALQLLSCVRLNVERLLSQRKLEQRAVRTELELCLEWLDAGLIEMRHSIVGLREGKGESLLPSLQRLLEDMRRFYRLDAELTWQVHNALPEIVESSILRIAQEALHNAAKHAHADRVAVIVETDDHQATLIVKDNGVGIDDQALKAPAGSGRYGLMNMREKAAAAGGKVAISGSEGQGTRVVLVLPLRDRPRIAECMN